MLKSPVLPQLSNGYAGRMTDLSTAGPARYDRLFNDPESDAGAAAQQTAWAP